MHETTKYMGMIPTAWNDAEKCAFEKEQIKIHLRRVKSLKSVDEADHRVRARGGCTALPLGCKPEFGIIIHPAYTDVEDSLIGETV